MPILRGSVGSASTNTHYHDRCAQQSMYPRSYTRDTRTDETRGRTHYDGAVTSLTGRPVREPDRIRTSTFSLEKTCDN